MTSLTDARHLVTYIHNLCDFMIVEKDSRSVYNHIGAVLTDVTLQAGLNYNNVVFPRVQRVLNHYATFNTTDAFWDLLQEKGAPIVLKWNHHEKINRLNSLMLMLKGLDIQYESDLRNWLLECDNESSLLSIKGIGPKTVDYLKGLLNISSVAVDRHVRTFIYQAGLNLKDYYEIKRVVEFTADLMGIDRRTLDYSIWSHVSTKQVAKSQLTNQLAMFC